MIMNNLIINDEPKGLIALKQYIQLLNDPQDATSFVNCYGAVIDRSFMGQFIRTDKDKFRIISNSSFSPLIYRGENKIYKNFIPSLLRIDTDSVEHAIEWIKKEEFINLIMTSPYNTYLSSKDNLSVFNCSFDIDFEAIAQHYGFATNYLDFSTDMGIAMFFAYTQYLEPGKFEQVSDFRKYSPVLYIGNMKKLYQEKDDEVFRIVGIQPVLRPTAQKALAFESHDEKSSFKDKFIKVELPKSEEMAAGIFEHFQGGEALFPSHDICTEYSKRIRDKYVASEYIDLYCDKFKKDKKDIQNKLIKEEYEITSRKVVWSQCDLSFMNCQIRELLLPLMGQKVGYRGTSKSLEL